MFFFWFFLFFERLWAWGHLGALVGRRAAGNKEWLVVVEVVVVVVVVCVSVVIVLQRVVGRTYDVCCDGMVVEAGKRIPTK